MQKSVQEESVLRLCTEDLLRIDLASQNSCWFPALPLLTSSTILEKEGNLSEPRGSAWSEGTAIPTKPWWREF